MSTPRLSLFQIEAELLGLIEQREDALYRRELADEANDGTASEACDEELQTIHLLIDQYIRAEVKKVDSVAAAIKQYDTMAEVHLKESDRLRKLAEREQETADRVREMVITVMQEFKEKKLVGRTATLRTQGNGGKQPVTITQPDLVPAGFKSILLRLPVQLWSVLTSEQPGLVSMARVIDIAPDKEAIRRALENKEGVPGCRLEERGVHLRIE